MAEPLWIFAESLCQFRFCCWYGERFGCKRQGQERVEGLLCFSSRFKFSSTPTTKQSHGKGSLLEGKCTVSFSSESLLAVPSSGSSKRASIGQVVAVPSVTSSTSLSIWRSRMVGSQRAMFLTLINNSDLTLELESSDVGIGSIWGQHPVPSLLPHQRCTVLVFTRSLSGTSGTLVWIIKESEKRLLLIFSNPQQGVNMLQVQTVDQYLVTTKMADRCVSGAVATFSRRCTVKCLFFERAHILFLSDPVCRILF